MCDRPTQSWTELRSRRKFYVFPKKKNYKGIHFYSYFLSQNFVKQPFAPVTTDIFVTILQTNSSSVRLEQIGNSISVCWAILTLAACLWLSSNWKVNLFPRIRSAGANNRFLNSTSKHLTPSIFKFVAFNSYPVLLCLKQELRSHSRYKVELVPRALFPLS